MCEWDQEAEPSTHLPPALDIETGFVWGLAFMVFLAGIAIVFLLAQSDPFRPGNDFALLFLGAFIGVAAIFYHEKRKHR